jgi:hypothetical protein
MPRRRGGIAAAILVLSNLVPLAGLVWWGWDAFVLLSLYWLETVVIGFWTILRVATMSRTPGTGAGRGFAAAFGMAGFFTVHAGIFMTVHMAFLWVLFAGPWTSRIHDARDFIRLIVIGSGLWIPLLALFAGQGALYVNDAVNRFVFGRPPPDGASDPGDIVGGFYKRIVLMHVAILGGGFVAQTIGRTAPLILLVLLKTALEFHFQFGRPRLRPQPASG